MSFHKENLLSVSNTIKQININIKYNVQLITSTALILYGKYYLQKINSISTHFTSEETAYDACASFLIATKITNYLCSLDTILRAVNVTERSHKNMRKEVLRREMQILIANDFDINFDMPYNYIKVIKEKVHFHMERDFIKMWVFYMNDSFLVPLYVRYHSLVIAFACLEMVVKKMQMEVSVKEVIRKGEWDIEEEDVEECVMIMKELVYCEGGL